MNKFRISLLSSVVVLVYSIPAGSAENQGKIVQETWDAAYVEGTKAGYVQTTVRGTEEDGEKILATTMILDLRVMRFEKPISLRMETGSKETSDGKVVGVFMKQFLGKQQALAMVGTVEEDKLHVLIDGGKRLDKKIPWNEDVVGLYRQQNIFRDRKVKPGDKFSYRSYEPQLTTVVTTHVTVKDFEDVLIPGTQKKESLLHVEAVSDKIEGFQPPPMTIWLNKDLMPVRSQVEMAPLGKMLLIRTTKEAALKAGTGMAKIDLGLDQFIALNRRIVNPNQSRSVVYRITLKGDDDDPTSTFAQDKRQKLMNVDGNTFEIRVKAVQKPKSLKSSKVKEEYLQSCYFLNSDDAQVQKFAKVAVGKAKDDWDKARIEKWVHDNLKNKNYSEAFATADHVARTLEGDCTEHAVLTAAMCRAAGVPARTAVGLLYLDSGRRPVMGFHMWTEVFAKGQWLPIDATLGQGYVGATHLKIADHSWADTTSLKPLLSVNRVLGKVTIEIISVDDEEG